ncbi:MAG: PHP domain-containing protein [Desulfobacterales bacterium]
MGSSPPPAVDLHIHSTASDGTLTPAEIIERATALGLGAISITDHDCLDGCREALACGIPGGLGFLTGVEISADRPAGLPGEGSLHILGYRIRIDDPALNEAFVALQAARGDRNPRIVERLRALGIPIALAEVEAEADGGHPGRPHIARVLVRKGIVATIDEAFARYLGNGRPAYIGKERIATDRAIDLIRSAGGVAVLAHPGLLAIEEEGRLEALLGELKSMGLAGLEVFFPDHDPVQTERFARLAARFDLLMTGGTDFHGEIQPEVEMGSGRGNLFVPYELYERILTA